MKEYPSIPGINEGFPKEKCIAFEKKDGQNTRYTWNKKQGWYKFGTRRHLFDKNCPEFGGAIPIFMEKYAEPLEKFMRDKHPKVPELTVFAEYCGPHSFAGKHDPVFLKVPENPMDVILFDVNVYKKGIMPPREFVDTFAHLHTPKVFYEGFITEDLIEAVRNGEYPVNEGVICKGGVSTHKLWMRKIKTFSYLKKLKEVFGTGWTQYWEE